jgi:hypothetical protein
MPAKIQPLPFWQPVRILFALQGPKKGGEKMQLYFLMDILGENPGEFGH